MVRKEQRNGKGKTRRRKSGEMRESFSRDTPHRKRERRVDETSKNRDKFTLHEFHTEIVRLLGETRRHGLEIERKGEKRMTKK